MSSSLCPQKFRKARSMKKSADTLDNRSVTAFGNPRLLMRVMNTQFLKSSPGFQVRNEVAAKVFSPSVRIQHLYPYPKLILSPGLIFFVCSRLLTLVTEEEHICQLGFVVNVGVHVLFSTFRFDWRLPP